MGVIGMEDYPKSLGSAYVSGDGFADINNLNHCVKYLNQALMTFGYPSSLDLQSNDPESIVQACNCIYALLQQRQRDIESRETANDQRQRLLSDMSRLEAKVERLESQLSVKERELAAMGSKEQKTTATFKAHLEKLQQERDEFQRLVITTQQVRVQQSHELKKKEKEYVKLQERLSQVLVEKKKETKTGMEIMNLLQKEGRQRGTWNPKKTDGDFYKMIVDAYEAKKQELMAENTDLRTLLRSMQSDMRDFLNMPSVLAHSGNSGNEGTNLEEPTSPLAGRTDVFDLPFHMARDQIEQSLRTKMATMKTNVKGQDECRVLPQERMVQLQQAHRVTVALPDSKNQKLGLEAADMTKHPSHDTHWNITPSQPRFEREAPYSAEEEDRNACNEKCYQHELEESAMLGMALELNNEWVKIDVAKRKLEAMKADSTLSTPELEILNSADSCNLNDNNLVSKHVQSQACRYSDTSDTRGS